MYLIEICFTSQSVISDTLPYKSVPSSNKTEGTSEEVLAIRVFTIPIGLPITKGISIPEQLSAETIDRSSYRSRKYPVFTIGLQMLSITSNHIFGMGYMTQRSSPG